MQERIRGHIRSNVVGYVALFFSLGIGTAWANHEDIFSDDIVDGEVKTVDIAPNAVGTGRIVDGGVQIQDLAANSVGTGKIVDGAVQNTDLAADSVATGNILDGTVSLQDLAPSSVGSGKIVDGAVQSADVLDNGLTGVDITGLTGADITNGTLTGADVTNDSLTNADVDGTVQERVNGSCARSEGIHAVASDGSVRCSQGPAAFSAVDDDTGIICNTFCTEGSLELPAGAYAIFGKIVGHDDAAPDISIFDCELVAGADSDQAEFNTLTGESSPTATLSMQVVHAFADTSQPFIRCRDFNNGDWRGEQLKITAIRVGSLTNVPSDSG